MKSRNGYNKDAGFSLVEILIVTLLLVALGGGLAYFYFGKDGSGKPGERIRAPITRARDTECQSNLRQARQSVTLMQSGDPDGNYPQSLAELRLPTELQACAVGKEPYQYDPATGQVRCVHPGHENF